MVPTLPDGVTPPGTSGRILHAGLQLFAESGFAGASIWQIGDLAGINSATLYAHYPSKAHVLATLVQIGHEEMWARLAEAAEQTRGETATRRLAALVRAHVLCHTDFPLLAVVTNGELHALDPLLALAAISSLGVQIAHWFVPRVDRPREHVADQYAHFALGMVGAA
jgi:AcrR family transcriptional regulator